MEFRIIGGEELALLDEGRRRAYEAGLEDFMRRKAFLERLDALRSATVGPVEPVMPDIRFPAQGGADAAFRAPESVPAHLPAPVRAALPGPVRPVFGERGAPDLPRVSAPVLGMAAAVPYSLPEIEPGGFRPAPPPSVSFSAPESAPPRLWPAKRPVMASVDFERPETAFTAPRAVPAALPAAVAFTAPAVPDRVTLTGVRTAPPPSVRIPSGVALPPAPAPVRAVLAGTPAYAPPAASPARLPAPPDPQAPSVRFTPPAPVRAALPASAGPVEAPAVKAPEAPGFAARLPEVRVPDMRIPGVRMPDPAKPGEYERAARAVRPVPVTAPRVSPRPDSPAPVRVKLAQPASPRLPDTARALERLAAAVREELGTP